MASTRRSRSFLERPDQYLACADEHGWIRHLRCPMLWLRGTFKHVKNCTTNQEFERYAKVEILKFIHVHITSCQTEEGPMRIVNAHRLTIFQGVKIEVTVFMMNPNEESRRWLSWTRAWKEEYDVCLSLSQGLSVAESEFVEFAGSEEL